MPAQAQGENGALDYEMPAGFAPLRIGALL